MKNNNYSNSFIWVGIHFVSTYIKSFDPHDPFETGQWVYVNPILIF